MLEPIAIAGFALGLVAGLLLAFFLLVLPERRRAEMERKRADRIFDAILNQSGHPPASEEGAQEMKETQAKWGQQQEEMKEVYASETDD